MIYFFTYLVLLWVVNAWHDADYFNKIDAHLSGAVLACTIIAGLFILYLSKFNKKKAVDIFNLVFVALVLRWVVFDLFWNILTGQVWYYVGFTSWMDLHIGNYSFIIKSVMLFICIPIVYIYSKRSNNI